MLKRRTPHIYLNDYTFTVTIRRTENINDTTRKERNDIIEQCEVQGMVDRKVPKDVHGLKPPNW